MCERMNPDSFSHTNLYVCSSHLKTVRYTALSYIYFKESCINKQPHKHLSLELCQFFKTMYSISTIPTQTTYWDKDLKKRKLVLIAQKMSYSLFHRLISAFYVRTNGSVISSLFDCIAVTSICFQVSCRITWKLPRLITSPSVQSIGIPDCEIIWFCSISAEYGTIIARLFLKQSRQVRDRTIHYEVKFWGR